MTTAIETYGLTEKQLKFCSYYLEEETAKSAAIKAGYAPKNADITASKLLKDDRINLVIDRNRRQREYRTQITADMVLTEIAKMATYQTSDLYYDDGRARPMSEMPKHVSQAISGIKKVTKTDKEGNKFDTLEYKMVSKEKMLELLGKHLTLFNDRVVHELPEGVAFNMSFSSKKGDDATD